MTCPVRADVSDARCSLGNRAHKETVRALDGDSPTLTLATNAFTLSLIE